MHGVINSNLSRIMTEGTHAMAVLMVSSSGSSVHVAHDFCRTPQRSAAPPPPPPPPAFDAVGDPCRCTQDGLSGDTFVYAVGCTIQIGPMYYCYVQEPASCPTAEPSNRFQGAAYRNC